MQYSPTLIDAVREERAMAHKDLRKKIRDYCGSENAEINGECALSSKRNEQELLITKDAPKKINQSTIDWPTRIYRAIVAMFVFLWKQAE